MLDTNQIANLTALKLYGTKHEVVLRVPGVQDRLLGYSARKTTQALRDITSSAGLRIIAALNLGTDARYTWTKHEIHFTGSDAKVMFARTQRDPGGYRPNTNPNPKDPLTSD